MDTNISAVRSAFGFARKSVNVCAEVSSKELFGRDMPSVIEGAELYDAICPVSKTTGKRCNPLSLLGLLTGAKSEVLNSLLRDLPTVASNPRLTDQDRIDFIVERCSTGTPAEDALMSERLMNDIDALGLSSKQADNVADSSISFAPEDVPGTKAE